MSPLLCPITVFFYNNTFLWWFLVAYLMLFSQLNNNVYQITVHRKCTFNFWVFQSIISMFLDDILKQFYDLPIDLPKVEVQKCALFAFAMHPALLLLINLISSFYNLLILSFLWNMLECITRLHATAPYVVLFLAARSCSISTFEYTFPTVACENSNIKMRCPWCSLLQSTFQSTQVI